MQVNHELLSTMGMSAFKFVFFLSSVLFSKIYQFLTFLHSKNTKLKETCVPTTPRRAPFSGLQL